MTDEAGPGPGSSRRRIWPWFVAAVVTAVLVAQLSDSFGWPWWVRGVLFGGCIGGFSGVGGRLWRKRLDDTSR